ncbi:MAG: hypothetical protein AB7G37_20915, partial [Solirubrobacteraceae bacterium]
MSARPTAATIAATAVRRRAAAVNTATPRRSAGRSAAASATPLGGVRTWSTRAEGGLVPGQSRRSRFSGCNSPESA